MTTCIKGKRKWTGTMTRHGLCLCVISDGRVRSRLGNVMGANAGNTVRGMRKKVLTMGKWVPLGGSKNPVGWCCLHRFTLSVNQMKRKRCLIKDCRHFRKKKEHNYWKAKERAKQARKERKNDAT